MSIELPEGALRAGPRPLEREPDAFEELYRTHVRAVANHLFRRTGDHHLSEDLTAEVFVRAMRALPKFRERGVPQRHWLLRIADNLAINHLTRRRRTQSTEETTEPAAREGDESEAGTLVRHALARLPKRFQTVLALHYLEGLSVDELAELLRCRPGTVKSRLSRGRDALRVLLESMRSET